MARLTISDKTLDKWRKEDIELHKRIITTYLYQEKVKVAARKKFFILYDMYIDESNIYDFFQLPVNIFVQALVLNQLDEVRYYVQNPNPKRIKAKRKKKARK